MRPSLILTLLLLLLFACKKSSVHHGPTITSITPTSAAPNDLDTIQGAGFSPDATQDVVKFGGAQATVQAASDSTLIVVVPTGGASGAITITTGSGVTTGPVFTYGHDVYVAGWEWLTDQYAYEAAKYWRNGAGVPLTGNNGLAYANGICLTDTDFYVIGTSVTTSIEHAYYWNKEGYHQLIGGSWAAFGKAITVVGGQVYATGEYDGWGGIRALEWTGDVTDSLSTGWPYASGLAITVSGGDVYIGGYDGLLDAGGNVLFVPVYWKNDSVVVLQHVGGYGEDAVPVTGIAVVGSNIYAVGKDMNRVTLWENGIESFLTDGMHAAAATGIQVVGNDIYVSGIESNGTVNVAKYWKNGVPVSLTDGTSDAAANAIAVLGGDVYVAGHETVGSISVAKYWKNGVGVTLGLGIMNSDALGIAVR